MATVQIRIGPADRGRRMDLEDFLEAEGQPGYRYELARGIIEVTNIPADRHGQVVDNLHEQFSEYRRHHPGLILRISHTSEIRLVIPELNTERHPDVALVFRGARVEADGHRRATLVVEVVSPGKRARRRDYEQKREEYLALGLGEYWIIDPKLRQVMVLRRQGDLGAAEWSETFFREDQQIVSQSLPGFEGRVSDLWADVELRDD